jgi:hypothetical protein
LMCPDIQHPQAETKSMIIMKCGAGTDAEVLIAKHT